MGLFSRFLMAPRRWAPRLDPGLAAAAFAAVKIPFGNLALTMISVWLGA
jgi:hypothetical protein